MTLVKYLWTGCSFNAAVVLGSMSCPGALVVRNHGQPRDKPPILGFTVECTNN